MNDIDLNDVAVFHEVVSTGSFTVAGQRMGLPASTVSRRIARLETAIGAKLLHRTTRSVGLTDAGRVYHQHTVDIPRRLEDAARAVNDAMSEPTGLVRVTAPPDDGGVIWALVSGFVAAHPQIDLELIHTLDYLDLVDEQIDIALRGGQPPDSTVFGAHQLFDSRILLVASPSYLEDRGTPESIADLESHDCIAMDHWAPNAIKMRAPKLRNRVRVNRLDTARAAAIAGFGIAPVLLMTCRRELENGALVEVLRGTLPMESAFWAVYPAGRKMTVAGQALLDHLIAVAPSVGECDG